MRQPFTQLKNKLIEAESLRSTVELLLWDQTVMMPEGGAFARGKQLEILARLAHQRRSAPEIGRFLKILEVFEKELDYDSDEAALIRVARRQYEKASRIPPAFKSKLQNHLSQSYFAWTKARPENNFRMVLPYLEKTLQFSQEYANFFPESKHPADPLIDDHEPGMDADSIQQVFADLRSQLTLLIQAIVAQTPTDNSCLYRFYPEKEQMDFGLEVLRRIGFDFTRGRQDLSPHPFTTVFTPGDVRITTRVKPYDFGDAFFSTIHEAGHALYGQGIQDTFAGLPLMGAASAGVDESQSRLWENIIGRGRAFWEIFYPILQAHFPDPLKTSSFETFYRAINKVQPSLIRTDADEVTYNLHVILRFDLELALLEGKLAVKDLPEAWRERFSADFGICPANDADGVLQDAHWYDGLIGGQFQSYAVGNILSAQFYAAALQAEPDIQGDIISGNFTTLHGWLKENIYQHGKKYTVAELVRRVTGHDLSIAPYIRYLKEKYSDLYQLSM